MRLRTKLAAVAVSAVAATGGLVLPTTVAVAAPTEAAACWSSGWSTKDGSTGRTNTNYVNIRSGPTTDCQSNGQAQMSHSLRYDCFVDGQNGTWSHVRDNATGVSGWIKDSLLERYGAGTRC
ncbi:SH3 domain-containing protein [Streptomyces sp. P9(2023)]|uniref:SH3 domain-containing protein n=1 Tax=Streptomyces sp. P9(2023) TaxID=3064394 RepID=UPI0028F45E17|nr:SH3 domain-containing protein [Streptomyces sp. P9(2023)]MDT9692507.1 SH3 domain-containing protein [Streptomyces sp. P9(2023)]